LENERRRFKRWTVGKNEFEVFSRNLGIHGSLKDISTGGLAYQYSPLNANNSDAEVIDILGKHPEKFILHELDCRKVYDIAELSADQTFTGASLRLKGLAFTDLTENQLQALETFLENSGAEAS